jgi:hypothetical protein
MATRSHVGFQNPDGTVIYCYIHYDGYPEGVGAELLKEFTPEGIKERVLEGDGSDLSKESAYKNLGETDVDAQTCPEEEYWNDFHSWVEWKYLLKTDGEILVKSENGAIQKLKDVLSAESV